MRIAIVNRKGGKLAGNIRSGQFSHSAVIEFTYSKNPQVIKDIQEVLLKYYDLKYIGGESGRKISPLVADGVVIKKSRVRHGGTKIKTPVKKEAII